MVPESLANALSLPNQEANSLQLAGIKVKEYVLGRNEKVTYSLPVIEAL